MELMTYSHILPRLVSRSIHLLSPLPHYYYYIIIGQTDWLYNRHGTVLKGHKM